MDKKRTLIALAVIMMAFVSLNMIMSDDSDARMTFDRPWGEGFTNTGDGTLFVPLNNDSDVTQDIIITVKEGDSTIRTATVSVEPGKTYTAKLTFRLDSAGIHTLRVTFTPAEIFPITPGGEYMNYTMVDIDVKQSVWSNNITYIAIVAVVILIVAAAYMKIRSAPATKPEITFTELEKQQKDSRGEDEKPRASATERRRYRDSEKRSKAEAAEQEPPPEKKAGTFTQLEEEKKAGPSPKKAEREAKKAERASLKAEKAEAKQAAKAEKAEAKKKPEPVPKKAEPKKEPEPQPKKAEPAPKKEKPKKEPAPKKEPEPAPKKAEPAPKKEKPKKEPAPKKAEPAPKKEPEPPPKKAEPAPKKEKPAEEPKKLKYVSSRRK